MLNFSNLNDVEFEYLCKDVMSRMLNAKLQRFSAGRDGGIDLTEDAYKKEIIVQVKYYVKTDVSGLLSSLKKELPKVEKIKPKEYYICCSKELTVKNKQDIYLLFSDYMESSNNIITLIEISDFLEEAENADILRKHFKLWIESTNILTDIFTNDICIDSDALLYDIKDSVCMFVKTAAYNQAVSCLEKNNVLIIIGNPGVGKTITSKMLVLHYATLGYRIRYTSDGADLASLKRALSQSPNIKEIILLDDCFGQAYFSMKETQENELLALIKYINRNPNKLLIMNSRVTIYYEARERTPNLVKSLDNKEYKAFVLDMTNVSVIEKAKILYNHLYFSHVPQDYRENIKYNKSYHKIVRHINYNPRIIEFVSNKKQYQDIEPTQYSDFIIQCLNNPEQIWKNEFERRLAGTDRMLLTILYSLTNTIIPLKIVKQCYEYRISKISGIDLSINHFEQSVRRLQDSMIKIVDVAGKEMLSTANPSVNDFISAYLEKNEPEKKAIIDTCKCVRQFKRLLSEEEYDERLKCIFHDKSVMQFVFESEKQKNDFIIYYCVEKKIYDETYKSYIESFILNPHNLDIFEERKIPIKLVYKKMLNSDVISYYGLNDIICNIAELRGILMKLDLNDVVEFVKQVDYLFEDELRANYVKMIVEIIKEKIEDYCWDVPAGEYDVDVGQVVESHWIENEHGTHLNTDAAIAAIDSIVADFVLDDIDELVGELPSDVIIEHTFYEKVNIYISGSSSLIEGYVTDDYADYLYEEYREREVEAPEIEYIFER